MSFCKTRALFALLTLMTFFAPMISLGLEGQSDINGGNRRLGSQGVAAKVPKEQMAPVVSTGTECDAIGQEALQADKGCDEYGEIANLTCNTMSVAGLDPQQGMMVEMMVQQAIGMVQQIKASGENQSQQCKNQADLSKLMGLINAAKAAGCASTIKKCSATCKQEHEINSEKIACLQSKINPQNPNSATYENAIKELRKRNREVQKQSDDCGAYGGNMMAMMMQAMNFGQNFLQNQQCAKTTAVNPNVGGTPPWGTPGTPPVIDNKPGGDCSDPNVARTSLMCVCKADPKNPMCPQTGPKTPTGPGVNPTTNTSIPRPYMPDTKGRGGGLLATGDKDAQAKPNGGVAGEQGGGGGGPSALGGNNGGGGGDDGGGHAPSNVDKNVITGASGSGGGGLGAGGGGGGGGGGRGSGSGDGFFSKFNLKKFLPSKKDYKNRGLAGMSVQATDGITGPMGPSIWEKVSNQYQVQKPNLIQDR